MLQQVVQQTRDDTALQNWGVIWIVQGIANFGGFIGTHALFESGHTEPPPFVALWGAIIALHLVVAVTLRRRRSGARTFVETQLWSIWTTFIVAVCLVAVLNHAMGLASFFLGPVIGVLAAVSFASMGSLMGRRWYVGTLVFTATAIAMALWHAYQFVILGTVWGLAQTVGGILLDRARRRRLAAGPHVAEVV